MPDYGMKISEDGEDVGTTANKNLTTSTKFNQFKIHAQGTFSVIVSNGNVQGTTTINHALGYAPAILVFLEETAGSGKKYMCTYKETNNIDAKVDNADLVIEVEYPIGSPAVGNQVHNGYYFIFKDNI